MKDYYHEGFLEGRKFGIIIGSIIAIASVGISILIVIWL